MLHVTTPAEKDTPAAHAVAALEKSGDDVEKAISIFEKEARSNRALREALLEPHLPGACSDLIWSIVRSRRKAVWSSGTCMTPGASKRIKAHIETRLMDFILPCGKRLGDAKRADLDRDAGFYTKQGEDMIHKGRWLSAIATRIKGEKSVSQVLKEADLDRLQTETRVPA